MHSKKYDNGAIWVACSECQRGGNGKAVNKCSCGGHIKRFNKLGCFIGELTTEQVAKIDSPVLFWNKTPETLHEFGQALPTACQQISIFLG